MINMMKTIKDEFKLNFSLKSIFLPKHLLKIQQFVCIFFRFFCKKIFSLDIKEHLPDLFQHADETDLKTAYQNLFNSLPRNKMKLIDRIVCLICLMSESIIRSLSRKVEKPVRAILKKIKEAQVTMKQFTYVFFIQWTLGYRVGRQASKKFFQYFFCANNEKLRETIHQFRKTQNLLYSRKNSKFDEEAKLSSYHHDSTDKFKEEIKTIFKLTRRYQSFKSVNLDQKQRKKIYLIDKKKERKDSTSNLKYWKNLLIKLKNDESVNYTQNLRKNGQENEKFQSCYENRTQKLPTVITPKLPPLKQNQEVPKQNEIYDLKAYNPPTKHQSFNYKVREMPRLFPKNSFVLREMKQSFLKYRQSINYD